MVNRRRRQDRPRTGDRGQGGFTARLAALGARLRQALSRQHGDAASRYTVTLGPQGLASLAVVSLCLLLWAFLTGLWLGQRRTGNPGPNPAGAGRDAPARAGPARPGQAGRGNEGEETAARVLADTREDAAATNGQRILPRSRKRAASPDGGAYVIQSGAFRNPEGARQEALAWQAMGIAAFVVRPADADGLYRVCLERFTNRDTAREQAERLMESSGRELIVVFLAGDILPLEDQGDKEQP